jgi:Leucine-rich repeat (LRR) protein
MSADPPRVIDRYEPPPVTWGRRIYFAMVAMIGLLATYPAYNHFQITRLEKLRSDVTNLGGRAPRARGGSRPASQIYWESLGGDLSRVVLHQVEFSQATRLERSVIARLRRCPELERLSLDGQSLDDDLCRHIFALRQLSELRVAFCELRDDQLQGIEHMDELTSLDLRGTRISDASVEQLARLAGLSELNLEYCDITPAGAQRLSQALPRMQIRHRTWPSPAHRDAALRLFRCGAVFEIPEDAERGLTIRLRRHIWRGQPQDLSDIAQLQGIELLKLSALDLEPELLEAVARLPNVELLSIEGCQLLHAELRLLGRSASIRRLILDNLFIEMPAAEQLAQWRGVKSLALVNARLVPGSLAALSRLPDLEELTIVGTRFRGTTVSELLNATALKRLHLFRVAIGDDQIPEICQLRGLESLTLTGMAVSNDSVDVLAGMPHLRHLDVSNTQMTPSGVAQLAAALPQCRVESGTRPVEELDVIKLLRRPGPAPR